MHPRREIGRQPAIDLAQLFAQRHLQPAGRHRGQHALRGKTPEWLEQRFVGGVAEDEHTQPGDHITPTFDEQCPPAEAGNQFEQGRILGYDHSPAFVEMGHRITDSTTCFRMARQFRRMARGERCLGPGKVSQTRPLNQSCQLSGRVSTSPRTAIRAS